MGIKNITLISACLLFQLAIGISKTSGQVTPFAISPDLTININGVYPDGYNPKWRYINSIDKLDFGYEQFVNKYLTTNTDSKNVAIGNFNGKAVVRFSAFITCDCVADIQIPAGHATISNTPQTYQLVNFRKFNTPTYEPCASKGNYFYNGGWDGSITLSGNQDGDIFFDLMLAGFAGNRAMSYRWNAKNISDPNLMTPAKAKATALAKEKAKEDEAVAQKNAAIREKQRAEFDEKYKKMLPKIQAMAAAHPKTVLTYKGYYLKATVSLSSLIGNHTCYSGHTSLDTLITKMDKGDLDIHYLLSTALKSFNESEIEPHNRDKFFTSIYLLRRKYNEMAIQIAARYLICDLDGVRDLEDALGKDASYLVDYSEYDEMVKYLNNKP